MKIAVIGGGPGGYVAAIRAAQLGAEVTLIEKDSLGGTCLNVGCIPTKALLHTAEVFSSAKNSADLGVSAEVKLDFSKAQAHKQDVVKKLVGGVRGLLAANKVKVVSGTASFKSSDQLNIQDAKGGLQTLTFDRIIIATGSVPSKPPIPGSDSASCIDSTGALELPSVPGSMVIIGGGVIGVEIATIYSALGSKVRIVEMLDAILPMMDREMGAIVRASLERRGVEIFTGAKVVSISEKGAKTHVKIERNGTTDEVEGEKVLIAIGRRTNTEALALEKAKVVHDRGRIGTDDHMETNVKGIYAIGDCTGKTMLAHVASAQGEIAAENAMGTKVAYESKTNPSCVYTDPELAGVGLTEEQAKEQGIEYSVGKFPLTANGKSIIANGGEGMVKLIVGKKYREIVGVHIVGPRATDLIAIGAMTLGMEATTEEFISTIFAHPTISEALREAALAAEKRAIHITNR